MADLSLNDNSNTPARQFRNARTLQQRSRLDSEPRLSCTQLS